MLMYTKDKQITEIESQTTVSQSPLTSESVTLHSPTGARGYCPAVCLVGHQSDMVSLGLIQGCFKMYWGPFRVGFRVGLSFLQGFLMVCFGYCWFGVYVGLV